MSDLIDRDFIKRLGGECIARRDRETGELIAITSIDLLPLARPEQQWIPCSERLPELNRPVLVSTTEGRVDLMKMSELGTCYLITNSDGRIEGTFDPEDYKGDDIDSLPKSEEYSFGYIDDWGQSWLPVSSVIYHDEFEGVTAWRPLPEAYKKE